MQRRNLILIGALIIILGTLLYTLFTPSRLKENPHSETTGTSPSPAIPQRPEATPPPPPKKTSPDSATSLLAPEALQDPRIERKDGKVFMTDPIRITNSLHETSTEASEDLSKLAIALQFYRLIFKENPEGGLNEEVVAQLTGRNSTSVVIISPDHPSIDTDGKLLDRWGTPYFFHGVSREIMEIWSAGSDREFGTPDDVEYRD